MILKRRTAPVPILLYLLSTSLLVAQTEEDFDRLFLGNGVTVSGEMDGEESRREDSTADWNSAEETPPPFGISGSAEYQSGISLEKDAETNCFYRNQGRIKLKPSYERERFRAYADIDYFVHSEAETETRENNSLECVEAYVEGTGFFLWKIGKQRFNWGAGDSYQPTDLMDQPDLRDSFMRDNDDRYTGVYALSVKYLMGDLALEAALRPVTGKALPPSGFFGLEPEAFESSAGTVAPRYLESDVKTELKDVSGALRFGGAGALYDWHLMYYSGMNRELLYRSSISRDGDELALEIQPVYRRMSALGADLSFALSRLNIRLEGVYSPDMPALSAITDKEIADAASALTAGNTEWELQSIKTRKYFSYSAGFDINLWGENGTVYVEWMQARYLNEDGIDPLLLSDVLMLRAEDSLFNQSLNISLGSMIRSRDAKPGLGIKSEAEYDFKTGLTAALGSYIFFSNDDEYIETLEDKDLGYMQIRYLF